MVSRGPQVGSVVSNQIKLIINVGLKLADRNILPINALIDTGAEVNLLRKGLVPPEYFKLSDKPKKFVAANQLEMEGGQVEFLCDLLIKCQDMDIGQPCIFECPTIFYNADIAVDAILSYEWLVKNKVDVKCNKHGLEINQPMGPLWTPGIIFDEYLSTPFPVGVILGFSEGPYQGPRMA